MTLSRAEIWAQEDISETRLVEQLDALAMEQEAIIVRLRAENATVVRLRNEIRAIRERARLALEAIHAA